MDGVVARLRIDQGDGRSISLHGELDAHTVTRLEAAFTGLGTDGDVDVDVSDLSFIDSSGLRLLIEEHQRLEEAGHRLVLRSPGPSVVRLIEITGLGDLLHVA